MEVDTSVYYREHSVDSSDHTGDSDEHSPTPSEGDFAMKTENNDVIKDTEDLSLNMSRLQISSPINAQVIINGNQSRLETIPEQNEIPDKNTSEGRLSEEDDETIKSEHGEEIETVTEVEKEAETIDTVAKIDEAKTETTAEVGNEIEVQIAEVESEIVQAETTTITEKEAETTEAKVEKEKTEATTEVEKEKIETEGKEKKKRKRKTELQSLIDTANNVNF